MRRDSSEATASDLAERTAGEHCDSDDFKDSGPGILMIVVECLDFILQEQ